MLHKGSEDMTLATSARQSCVGTHTVNKVDLTNYTTLHISIPTMTRSGSLNHTQLKFMADTGLSYDESYTPPVFEMITTDGDFSYDISSITGEYYIIAGVLSYSSGSIAISPITAVIDRICLE